MTLVGWSYLGSFTDPIFLIPTALFVAIGAQIAKRMATAMFAAEIGALYGYLYGVVVWGSLGYAFGFDGRTKLLFAGCALVDGIVLVTVLQIVLSRRQAGRDLLGT
ncbi:MAG TPA: hypothetical protein VGC20_09240 [bacterium]|jgi:hypothetical protein